MKTKLLVLLFLASLSTYAQTNLVPNSGFETWTNSTTLSNWTIENSVTQNTSNYTEGSKSAQLTITNSTTKPKITVRVPITAGTTYTVKFKYKYVSANFSGQHPISLNISQNGSATTLSSSTFATDNNWTVKETAFTPDQNLSYDLSISLYTFDAAAFNVLIDDVQVYVQGTEQYTTIPDVNFENKLIALGIDSGVTDGKVLTSSIASVTTLNVDTTIISDLTGIQDFVALKTLTCIGGSYSDSGGSGRLTKLDVTKNVALTSLTCYSNKLKNIDLSQNVLLKTLKIQGNGMTTLDVSKNVALTNLDCDYNILTDLDVSKNVALVTLDCFVNKLTSLDVSKNTALITLNCQINQLTDLDVSKNTALQYLDCGNNKLTALDVSKNVGLVYIKCNSNQLTDLDVSKNKNLTLFVCNSNKLLSLNLKNGKNTSLNNSVDFTNNPHLSCIAVDNVNYSNTNWVNKKENTAFFSEYICNTITQIPDDKFEDKLIALGIDTDGKNGLVLNSSIGAITSIDLSNSSITNLKGIQGFTALTTLNCSGNILKKLDLSKNTLFSTLNCSNNPSLRCIQVNDIKYATANWITIKDAIASYNLDCTAYTLIPDPIFEDKLIALGIDQDGKNGKVATESIASITSLNVSASSIVDLTGIQDFAALTFLNCSSNWISTLDLSKNLSLNTLNANSTQIKTLDVSNNIALTNLSCDYSKLTSLNVSKNIALIDLSCNSNQLTSLDVSKNIALIKLSFDFNQIKTLDITNNLDLNNLFCSHNQLTAIDISKNLSLKQLDYSFNKIPSLDISKHLLLTYLQCESNQIEYLDVSKNINLINLRCKNNNLKTIDISKNTSLFNLNCDGNQLTSLDVSLNKVLGDFTCTNNNLFNLNIKNGNNNNFYLANSYSNFKNNPNLSCIQVDDVTYSNSNWANKKDITASFSNTCQFVIPYTLIPDPNFEDKLITLGIDTDGKNGKVTTANIASLTSLEVSNSNIASLTGIEGFTSLTYLDCSGNSLTALNIDKNTLLTDLYCNINKLTNIDVSKNLILNKLNVSGNSLTTLDVSKNYSLTEINCFKNSLTSLNLKNGKNVNMKRMYFANLAQNPNLQCIQVDNAAFCNSNWDAKDATAGYSSDCTPLANTYTTIPDAKFEDKLIALGIDKDGKNGKVLSASIYNVGTLDVSNSGITDLTGIQDFRMITSLTCGNNTITTLDVSKNQSLDKLYCSVNKISNLDISKNTVITVLSCSFNLLSTINVTTNKSLKELECSNNNLTYLNIQNGNNANMQNMIFGNFTNNPKLTCILVDNEAYSTTNWGLAKDKIASYNTVCVPYTIIPDSNFEQKLIDLGIDTDGKNGKVLTTSIKQVISLDVADSNISDLTGIESFTELKYFFCERNKITSVDLSKNLMLENVAVSENNLTNLDVSKNSKLRVLEFAQNQISSLDLSHNTNLSGVGFNFNKITEIDFTNNNLTELHCRGNSLTKINLATQTNLKVLECGLNKIASLDLTTNIKLEELDCAVMELTNLNVSENKELVLMNAFGNQLTSLDVSQNPKLKALYVEFNPLKTLNLQNGNNENFVLATPTNKKSQTVVYTSFLNNPNLSCILVDNVAYSDANWVNIKDATATYSSIECKSLSLPSNNFNIESKGETCLGSNNGEISITATATHTYKASINAISYSFTNNSLNVSNLVPGTYTVTITIPGENFEQNFTITIPKGASITGKSSVVANKVSVEITEGTAPYTVFVDGIEQFETTDSNFTVVTKKEGLLQVKTAKACEGIYAKDFARLDEAISAYPNPTSGSFEIELPTIKKEVVIALYTLDGHLISTKTYTVENGKAQLSLENQPAGVYVAKIELDTPDYLKIIKN